MFIDEARIHVRGGKGGSGAVSFRREKYEPKGGPNGGDGGHGGNVILQVDPGLKTLMDFSYRRHFFAKKGAHGGGSDKTGKTGEDIVLKVPPGTLVKDEDGEMLFDLVDDGDTAIVAKGGRGGRGNAKFSTPTNRAPTYAQPGEEGEERTILLELKLLADVAIIGFPNAGKSTLINRISAAKAKVAAYQFTTTAPNLGAVMLPDREPFIVADIPGLVEGAYAGKGMGLTFLRHIERAGLLVHLVDISSGDGGKAVADYEAVNKELVLFNERLAERPMIVAGNKTDMLEADVLDDIIEAFAEKGITLHAISAMTGAGVDELVLEIADVLDSIRLHTED